MISIPFIISLVCWLLKCNFTTPIHCYVFLCLFSFLFPFKLHLGVLGTWVKRAMLFIFLPLFWEVGACTYSFIFTLYFSSHVVGFICEVSRKQKGMNPRLSKHAILLGEGRYYTKLLSVLNVLYPPLI